MRIRCVARTSVLFTLFGLTSILSPGCSTDPPTTPKPVHYNVYATVNNWWGGDTSCMLRVYDADSLTLIDSLALPNTAVWGEASPDARFLYLSMWQYPLPGPMYLLKLDLATGDTAWIHPGVGTTDRSKFSLLDSGRLIVYGSEVIDAADGTTIRTLDDTVFDQWDLQSGPPGGTEVAAIANDTLIVATDIRTGVRRGGFVARLGPDLPPIGVNYARLHPDGDRVVCMARPWLVIGELSTGRQLMVMRLSTWNVDIAINDDGSLAAVVDAANSQFEYGWPAVYVLDLVNNQLLATFDSNNQLRYWPGQVRFLPGDRRIVIAPGNEFTPIGWLQTFDLRSLSSEYVIDPPFYEPMMGALAVGPRLEE